MAGRKAEGMSIELAMAIAVTSWGGMLVLLLILAGVTVGVTWPVMDAVNEARVDAWFISAMALVAVLPTLAGFVHRYIFQHRRTDRGTVTPEGYVLASLTLWAAISVAGIWSVVGCLASGEMIPHVLPLFIAMFLLLGMWPTGKAMVKPRSLESEDDTEILHIPPEDE